MLQEVLPLGRRFNPFDPQIQAKLNEVASIAAKVDTIYEDLQRVVAQTWLGGAGFTLPFMVALLGPAIPMGSPNRWRYPWAQGQYNPGSFDVVPMVGGINSGTAGETLAINLMEQVNSDTIVNAGEDITDLQGVYDVSACPIGGSADPGCTPLPQNQPALLVGFHNDGVTTTRAIGERGMYWGWAGLPLNGPAQEEMLLRGGSGTHMPAGLCGVCPHLRCGHYGHGVGDGQCLRRNL
jgi:hypothetical protein